MMVKNTAKAVDGVVYRYATALFELSQESGKNTSFLLDQLSQLVDQIQQQPSLKRFLTDPRVAPTQQQPVLAAVIKNAKIDPLVEKFLLFLTRQRRFAIIEQILASLRYLQIRKEGGEPVEVISARPLTASQQQEISTVLGNQLNKKAIINFQIDPTLLGGFKIQIGSRVVDSSIQSKLMRLQHVMRGVG